MSGIGRAAARATALVAILGLTGTACAAASTARTAAPAGPAPARLTAAATFSDPPDTGHVIEPLSGPVAGLGTYGYVEHEYFASGTATAFRTTATPSDGRWTVAADGTASYRTRILVRRPADSSRFDGTVVVEWLNETSGEACPDWDYMNPELMRSGTVWVGVSAQALGVEGGSALLGAGSAPAEGLVSEEPARYGSLHHPGDRYAFDLFAQVGRALEGPAGGRVLGGLRPRHVVAVGESQSAAYLTTFADAVQPLTHAYDGIFIHSRGGGAAALDGSSAGTAFSAGGVRIRTDLGVPVFLFETQTDVVQFGFASALQPDSRTLRTWEVAGTSHVDSYLVGGAASLLGCTAPVNTGPQHLVVQAALAAFLAWVAHGTPPPSPAPFKLKSLHPIALDLDAQGNAVGGVRTPAVDVPVSTLTGAGPATESVICQLFGSTTAFPASTLVSLYRTPAHYLADYTAALDRAIGGGYILAADRAGLLAQAEQVRF